MITSPVRVLQVGPGPKAVGGMTKVAAVLDQELDSDPDVSASWVDSGGGRGVRGYVAFPQAVRACLLADYDVLHIHLATHGSIVRKGALALIAALRRKPYVLHLHGGRMDTNIADMGRPLRWLTFRLMTSASSVVTLGEFWKRWVLSETPVAEAKVTIVQNGVEEIRSQSPEERGPVVLFVGNLEREKGIYDLVRVIRRLLADERLSAWHYAIVGPSTEAEAAQAVARLASVGDGRVHAPGAVFGDALTRWFRESSILVLPSYVEGLPMVVLEAMSAGMAVVTTPVGSIPDAVTDGHNGLLVDPGSVEGLEDALRGLMTDRLAREAMQLAAKDTWRANYSSTKSTAMLKEIWVAVARQRTGQD